MSRVGKAAVTIPQGVEVTIAGASITVKGSKGSLSRQLPAGISVKKVESTVVVERASETRDVRASHGMIRAMVNNMVSGVTEGYVKELEIIGVGRRAGEHRGNDLAAVAIRKVGEFVVAGHQLALRQRSELLDDFVVEVQELRIEFGRSIREVDGQGGRQCHAEFGERFAKRVCAQPDVGVRAVIVIGITR